MIPARADVTGSVWVVRVAVGDQVKVNEELVILESMKMEIPVIAPVAGTVAELLVQPRDSVKENDIIAMIRPT